MESHAAVLVLYTPDRQVLLLNRNSRSLSGWSVPGGFAEPGEEPIETALRECLEETHILMLTQELKDHGEMISQLGVLVHIFSAPVPVALSCYLSPEHSDFVWATREQMHQLPLAGKTLEFIQRALEVLP
jgi:8-oxo-dGTP pyrophosphatase MutT (NUDIX family)